MKATRLKPNQNYKTVIGMLSKKHTFNMVRVKSKALNAEFLIFPNQIVFSYPITIALPAGTSRHVKNRLDRDLEKIHTTYEPRYTLESFLSQPHAKELLEADLEKGEKVDQEYIDTVNILWYVGHRCKECGGYRTDVGFDEYGNLVYQSLECGHLVFDKTQTEASTSWVTNLMGWDASEGE